MRPRGREPTDDAARRPRRPTKRDPPDQGGESGGSNWLRLGQFIPATDRTWGRSVAVLVSSASSMGEEGPCRIGDDSAPVLLADDDARFGRIADHLEAVSAAEGLPTRFALAHGAIVILEP